ncbi:MAG TPA: ABC transporter ATP-binding protein [Acetobacteraceae bacterium]|nr:ABC transporter ATP-binding protein [Acetobacteraceae bacterium]
MAELRIEGLARRFGRTVVLDHVDLVVPTGRLVAILGASGSGKTTLLRLIAGFDRADGGTIRIDGALVAGQGRHEKPEHRRIGYVAQEGALFPHLSVARNIAFGLKPGTGRARRVADLLEMVGLPAAYGPRPPHALSGGEQQRVALARALAPAPRLVLLDEPFSALDASLRQDTRQAVAAALAAIGATAVLVTHDQSEALSMGAAVAVLRDGRMVQTATPATLYRHPADAEVAQFVGEAVLLPGRAAAGRAICALGELPLGAPAEGPAEVLIRPEQIRLVPHDAPGSVAARVAEITFFGHDALVRLALPGAPDRLVTARVFGHAVPEAGTTVGVIVDGEVSAFAPPAGPG